MKNSLLALLVASGVCVFSTPASAAAVIFFDVCGSADCFTLGHAVRLDFDATQDGTALPSGAVFVDFTGRPFGDNAFGINVAGNQPVTISRLSSNFTLSGTNQTVGPFGTFEYVFDAPPGGGCCLSFTLMREGGFSDYNDVLEMNAAGFFGAANITSTPFPGFPTRTASVAGDGPVVIFAPVPEPGTMMLLATGLAAAWRVRRRHNSA